MARKRKRTVKPRPQERDHTGWIVGPAIGAAVMFVLCVLAYTYGGRPW